MKIKINGEVNIIEAEVKLSDLVFSQLKGKEPKGIAVALNEMVIPKQKWELVSISENDSVEIIHAVQGG